MRLSPGRLLSAALLLLASGVVSANDERQGSAQGWLESMVEAVRSQTYEGVFVYRYRGELQSMRILHRIQDGVEQERLFALSGSRRKVIREGEKVTCVLPDVESVVVNRRRAANPLTDVLPMDVDTLEGTYRFEVEGQGRVAGREAVRIGIQPVDQYRYGYRLWVDRASRLLLRADLIGGDGEAVEQLMFTEIHVRDSLPDAAFADSVQEDGFTWYEHGGKSAPASGDSRWRITELPPGFELRGREWIGGDGAGASEHHLYSDGLATVSVYIEPNTDEAGFVGSSAMGAVSAFGRVVAGHQVVVVGEVPARTVRMIGRGIEPGATQ